MPELTIAVRFLHLAASMLPLGIFTFLYLAGTLAAKRVGIPAQARFAEFEQSQWRILAWSLAVILFSGLAAFALQAANMSGLPLAQSLTPGILAAVLATQYGKAWLLRQTLLFLLAIVTAQLMQPERRQTQRLRGAGFGLAAALLGAGALTGHAAAGDGALLLLHLHMDALHLLAAGAWLGALVPLAQLLEACRYADAGWARALAQEAARRFSLLGLAAVGTLIFTGIFNAWMLVGDPEALVSTAYGRLLLIKLGLLVPLLALAATNLLYIRPRMLATARDGPAFNTLVARLRRNTLLEASIGGAVLLVVAMLGVTPPARHVPPFEAPAATMPAH